MSHCPAGLLCSGATSIRSLNCQGQIKPIHRLKRVGRLIVKRKGKE
jgi:hypothetical protein